MNGLLWLTMVGLFLGTGCAKARDGFSSERREMVERQLKARGITNEKVLQAMAEIPRENYVPEAYRHRAYKDGPLPIGYGQTISQPYIVAFMTEVLDPKSTDRVLEVGTGSGYQAAVLSPLVKDVFTIEIVDELAEQAKVVLKERANVSVRSGDGYKGWPEEAPFDAIIVTCAPDHIPQPLLDQLKEGGRMIIPLGAEGGVQQLVLLKKEGGVVHQTGVLDVRFVPMTRETD